ncbi:hypothetical protein HHK36_000921 [Tetracentron sinense]|uniref:Homeobox domain-containing protein n=1 Tax=Tetracentron sinense TaxID=13715 RepID=A0A834ZRW3_TETSI|nr:hypothetical protein HHK36_000921 [Tetracentron sinense]
MAVEKEDLRLSLSLASAENRHPLQLNLMPSSLSPSPFMLQKGSWNEPFASAVSLTASMSIFPDLGLYTADRNSEIYIGDTRSFFKGIDVNRMPSTADGDEEVGVSSPNSTISSVSGKRSERDANGEEENETERDCFRGISDEEDGDNSRKKLRLSKDQSAVLEETFKEHNTLNPKQKLALAKQLNLRPRQVEVWFQNRRARTKLKQTEVDCEVLKRCCENLTEENRRLQKEVQELRALKLSPQFYMQMNPPTTLTMCPSCERVAVSSASSSAADVQRFHHRSTVPINNPWAATSIHHRPLGVPRP